MIKAPWLWKIKRLKALRNLEHRQNVISCPLKTFYFVNSQINGGCHNLLGGGNEANPDKCLQPQI